MLDENIANAVPSFGATAQAAGARHVLHDDGRVARNKTRHVLADQGCVVVVSVAIAGSDKDIDLLAFVENLLRVCRGGK